MRYIKKKESGDPSNQSQIFTNISLKVLCCRYWSLSLWDCNDMIFPYWRIYWNKNDGGQLGYNDELIIMKPDHVYIIPPFTSFYTRYKKRHIFKKGINVSGKVINAFTDESKIETNLLIHLFIHFNLGIPFDNVSPGIHKLKLTTDQFNEITQIISRLKIENINFSIKDNLKIQAFIMEALSRLGKELWDTINVDDRVLKTLRFIEANMNEKFSNSFLAKNVSMAPNSFARLFKTEMKITLHNFVQKRKIARACEMFDHSNNTIEEVAYFLGYSDRYHFSRVFKSFTGIPPAKYKSGTVITL